MTREILVYVAFIMAIPLFMAAILGAGRLVLGRPPTPIEIACAEAVKSGRMDDNTAKTCQEALKK